MSLNPTASPVSSASLNPTGVVSDLENALMQSIGQGLKAGSNSNSATLQPEMQLLTALLNQSNETQSNPSQPDGNPMTSNGPSRTGNQPVKTNSDPSKANADPSKSNNDPKTTSGLGRKEAKLDSALEQNITNLLDNGQSPKNNNALEQEMNLLIQLLHQNA